MENKPTTTNGQRVLVTGGSGFVAAHCIIQLLDAGYDVRTTVRSLKRKDNVLAMLKAGGAKNTDTVTFVEADLMRDTGWAEAVSGCDFVLHVASPFPPGTPKHEDDLIVPAREGALRVLRAARDAGVKRVVLTSSFAAIGYGVKTRNQPFSEENWTDAKSDVSAYVKSKTLAERAAWNFIAHEGGALELSVVNPVGVFGPVLGPDLSTSIHLVKMLMDGAMPGTPKLSFGIVDVRDVADLHLRAMTHPEARSQRFLAIADNFMQVQEIAQVLRKRLGDSARRVPTKVLPNWLVRISSLFNPMLRSVTPELGKTKNATNEKAKRVLGWNPRSSEDALTATAESLMRLGLLKH
ncbi:SDR family oxidoreductase [Chryseolinea lacunae]|uniref:Aldehyde reductase n=1 Tax=Chryseolinea lacunae TaxID=2801331 RepID=A0ABS1L018_9BACT|nr:aldehyde reductase [Chryseolinea lacunae]MBL0743916.1 aldehyde reductase [Chryseolinea lacunae]